MHACGLLCLLICTFGVPKVSKNNPFLGWSIQLKPFDSKAFNMKVKTCHQISTYRVLQNNKTKEDFSSKRDLGQQDKKALLVVEK